MAKQNKGLILFGLIILLALFYSQKTQISPPKDAELAEINFVFDGDTVRLKFENGSTEKVRLLGVDTPEIESEFSEEECFGEEASAFSKNVALGHQVEVIKDPLAKNRDKFGRLLRHLRLEDGQLLSEKLLRAGHARVFEFENFEKKEPFKDLEDQAREANLGLWATCPVEQL